MRDDIEVIALELCEFCKSEPELHSWGGRYDFRCPGCREMTETKRSPDDCAHVWNVRMRKIQQLKVGKNKDEFEEFQKFFDKLGVQYELYRQPARVVVGGAIFRFSDGVFIEAEDDYTGVPEGRV